MRLPLASALVLTATLLSCDGDGSTAGAAGSAGSGGTGGGGAGGAGASGGSGGSLVCDSPFVTKGPWALGVDGQSAKVRFEACSDAATSGIAWAPEAGGAETVTASVPTPTTLANKWEALLNPDAPPDFAGTYWIHEAAITGLTPGTCYSYHLVADATRSGRFCTAAPSGAPIRFMAIGDTNPGLGHTDGVLANALPLAPDFTIHGGDIQYYSSFLETWSSWFPVMQPMLSRGAFFPAIGNHESEMSDELSEYALRFFGGAGFDGSDVYYRFETGGVSFFTVNTEDSIGQGTPQAAWLEAELMAAAAAPGHRFSVVYFHRPLYTCGDSGDDLPAAAWLEPIFLQYGVKLVLQAHMHGYERFQMANGITYVTAAGGGGLMGNVDENLARAYCASRVASGPHFHAVIFDVGATTLDLQTVAEDGTVVDSASLPVP